MRIPSDEKYNNDSTFRILVDSMLNQVMQLNTSFSEVREACLFAQLKYEMYRTPRTITFSPQLLEEIEFRTRKKE